MNLNIDSYSIKELKKLFTINDNLNLFNNEFTLQDIESIKQKLYFMYQYDYRGKETELKDFLDKASKQIIEDKFSQGSTEGVVVKNTIKDSLNPNYKNTITRVTEIDSQYRPVLFQCNYDLNCNSLSPAYETYFSSQLTDTLTNTISLNVSNICIPFTFYNIESSKGNHLFKVDDVEYTIVDGNYTLSTLITTLNNLNSGCTFSINSVNGKTTIDTSGNKTITFYDKTFLTTYVNNSLGWILGFRNISCDGLNNVTLKDDSVESLYTFIDTLTSETIAYIPQTKYFVICLDDHNKNESGKSLVQLSQGKEHIKNTSYYKNVNSEPTVYYRHRTCKTSEYRIDAVNNVNSECLDLAKIKPDDLKGDKIDKYNYRQLTKKQLYTQAAINDTNQENPLKVVQPNLNNVLAIIPFESKSLVWGTSLFFSDKNKYSRDYHGPVDIHKLTVKIYDDKGYLLNLNGQNWSMTLLSNHLYKY